MSQGRGGRILSQHPLSEAVGSGSAGYRKICVDDRRRPPHKFTVPCVLPPHAGWLSVSQQARYHDLLVSLDRLTADERRVMAKAAEGTVGFRSRFKGREAQEQYRSVRRQGAIYRGVSEGGMLLVSNFTPDIRLCL